MKRVAIVLVAAAALAAGALALRDAAHRLATPSSSPATVAFELRSAHAGPLPGDLRDLTEDDPGPAAEPGAITTTSTSGSAVDHTTTSSSGSSVRVSTRFTMSGEGSSFSSTQSASTSGQGSGGRSSSGSRGSRSATPGPCKLPACTVGP